MRYTKGNITVSITGDLEDKSFVQILEELLTALKQEQVLETDSNFDK